MPLLLLRVEDERGAATRVREDEPEDVPTEELLLLPLLVELLLILPDPDRLPLVFCLVDTLFSLVDRAVTPLSLVLEEEERLPAPDKEEASRVPVRPVEEFTLSPLRVEVALSARKEEALLLVLLPEE